MGIISFDIENSCLEDYLITKIYINSKGLREIIRSIEYKQLDHLSSNKPIAVYEGLSAFIEFYTHNHFCKETINEYRYQDNRFALFEYTHSGIPDDHTSAYKIDIDCPFYIIQSLSKKLSIGKIKAILN